MISLIPGFVKQRWRYLFLLYISPDWIGLAEVTGSWNSRADIMTYMDQPFNKDCLSKYLFVQTAACSADRASGSADVLLSVNR